ncbi:MAG: hypothetical protein ACJA09_002507 [Alcanivorax sp.]|jgi:hypothetical protein
MISLRFLIVLSLPLSVACSTKEANPYCDNHGALHQEHSAIVADLHVRYLADGEVEADLIAPLSAFKGAGSSDDALLAQQLVNTEAIFGIEAERACVPGAVEFKSSGDQLAVHYKLSCGVDNKLGAVTVRLFDEFPHLQEVEARINTPVVEKRFVISRQCPKAMFAASAITEK